VIRQKSNLFSVGYVADIIISAVSIYIGLSISYEKGLALAPTSGSFIAIAAFTLCCAIALVANRLNQTVWRWTTATDLLSLAQAVAVAGIGCVTLLFFADPTASVPRVAPAIAAGMTFVLAAGARGMARVYSGGGLRALFRSVAPNAPATILVGPTEAITKAIHEARMSGLLPIRPIAIVSTAGNQIGKIFAGARVYGGLENLEPLVVDALSRNDNIRIALIGKDPQRKAAQIALAVSGRKGVELMRIAEGAGVTLGAVHPADVLGRTHRVLDLQAPRALVRHKRVLVTGAGGTIGSEIVKQIAQFGPASIILVDASENNLYEISTAIADEYPGLPVIARLCDVRDAKRINDLFDKYQPNVVVHAAANKHVPMMEAHFCHAIEVNLGGTVVVAEAALAVGVESFVFISTDKAVNSVNVMGAAKRVAELYVQDCASRAQGAFHSVRFGNVLGSSGSVMPLFERQIAKGGPVTVTHKEMTRWFMTVGEASTLVLQAAALGASSKDLIAGGQFVLDMGEPVKIIELAEAMIRMKGKEPRHDIAIIETGLRPGERLHEELFHTFEKVVETDVDGVMIASNSQSGPENLGGLVEKLLQAARLDQDAQALALLQRILPSYGRTVSSLGTKLNYSSNESGRTAVDQRDTAGTPL
jgi:FlaA1/EpsC-like NDP-sugar epimerase